MVKSPYPNLLKQIDFIERFGSIYEHSPWVAEAIYPSITPGLSAATMANQMAAVVDGSSRSLQYDLLCAHPDLAGRLRLSELTAASRSEQTGAGLDQCTEAELAEFQSLNARYLKRFGFPFIFAVAGFHRTQILEAFRERVNHSPEDEFLTALMQVHRIARSRLEALADA